MDDEAALLRIIGVLAEGQLQLGEFDRAKQWQTCSSTKFTARLLSHIMWLKDSSERWRFILNFYRKVLNQEL